MSDQLFALRLFVRVARTGSFSQAAREQNLSQPTASRTIAMLEARVGATLFVRTTRAVTLTEAGNDYLARVQPILEALDEADHMARGTGELRGTLRIGISSVFASRAVVPRLAEFVNSHPNLRIELLVDDRRQELIVEGVDVALRFGRLADSSSIARLIGRWPMMIAASPAYLAAHGEPSSPAELAAHDFVVAGPVAGKVLVMRAEGREVSVEVAGNLAINGAEVAVNAGVAGLGLVAASYPALKQELDAGQLVRLLPEWDMGEIEAHALFPSGQTPKPSARLFVDYIIGKLRSF